ncbi:MAG TPA: hypothetical protein EYH46_00330 [Sulfurivirga caldicuralii]|nr:hypothetical protein [Sulfurivirga caldicuralii]
MSLLGAICRRYEAPIRQRLMQPDAWRWEYDLFLPWLARQPWPVFDALAHLRARLHACLRHHWKEFLPFPNADYWSRLHHGAQEIARFYQRSEEEIIGAHLHAETVNTALVECMTRLQDFAMEYVGAVETLDDPAPRLWLFAHIDATIALFPQVAAKRRVPVDAVMTQAVIDPILPQPIVRFFNRRAQRFAAYTGGKVFLAERHGRAIFQALAQRRDMFLALDMPATPASRFALHLPLFGARRAVAIGVLPWAQRYGYKVQTVSVHYLGRGCARVVLGELVDARNLDQLQSELNTMAARIESMPEKWELYEQLPAYPLVP